jgi:hypothetical protein
MPVIHGVEVQTLDERDGWPSHMLLSVDVENPSARIKLLSARCRISYSSRRVAMLSLEDKVVVPARSRSVVELPLHLAVQRTSQTLAFREALREHRSESISIDWQVALRSRMTYLRDEQGPRPIAQVLTPEQLEALWEMLDER